MDDIVYIIEQLHAEQQRRQLTIRARPKVTVDSSLLAYKFLETSLHPSDGVSLICRVLANRNIDVSIIAALNLHQRVCLGELHTTEPLFVT